MAQRYARIDVDFAHKRTARRLTEELGLVAPYVFITLILRAKDGIEPGTFVYRSDAVGWEKLGFDPEAMPFTLDQFFAVTGRLRQTSRKRLGDVWNVKLTQYGEWQKDSKRYEEAAKKSRTRGKSTGDTSGTQQGTQAGHKGGPSTRSRSTPKPPLNGRANPFKCPHCRPDRRPFPNAEELAGHLEDVHGIFAALDAA